ncbi:hypothetical protein DFH07DRAFT_957044 [Mycena maculata]|uniref:Uncharacterized protein n=1 Tax=Mycena maculata TaxID=230809 RepID=A0AAD7JCK3_9AGAR|nr:hypothetical protein DFH07DRAFT_957044 [Mycena maculata]
MLPRNFPLRLCLEWPDFPPAAAGSFSNAVPSTGFGNYGQDSGPRDGDLVCRRPRIHVKRKNNKYRAASSAQPARERERGRHGEAVGSARNPSINGKGGGAIRSRPCGGTTATHPGLHSIIADRGATLSINLVLGQRAKIFLQTASAPPARPTSSSWRTHGAYPQTWRYVSMYPSDHLFDTHISPKVTCIGGTPLSAPFLALPIADTPHSCAYSPSGTSPTRAHEAAGQGHKVAVQNIVCMIAGYSPNVTYVPAVPRIRVSVGLHSDVTFENPRAEGRAPGVLFTDMEDGTHEEEEMSRMYEWRVKRAGARGHQLLPVLTC